jgi:hypothetical protein
MAPCFREWDSNRGGTALWFRAGREEMDYDFIGIVVGAIG